MVPANVKPTTLVVVVAHYFSVLSTWVRNSALTLNTKLLQMYSLKFR